MDTSFEWDERKNLENLRKHGISFEEAQLAFADPNRLIFQDTSHSTDTRTHGHRGAFFLHRPGTRRNPDCPFYPAQWRYPHFWRRLLAQVSPPLSGRKLGRGKQTCR